MDSDFNVCRMTLQNILQTKDLSHSFPMNDYGKDEKDFDDIAANASAAFLGPNLWDDMKTPFVDIDNFFPSSPDECPHTLENLDSCINNNDQPFQKESNVQIPDMQTTQSPSQSSPYNASKLPSYCNVTEKRRDFAVDCKFSPTDLALATPPGHKHYDPASTVFPEEELKPQPIIKKSRKNFVPDDLKDDKYWARRHKNNIAAKRSREARRLKENQIVLRASYLEKENNTLKEDVIRLQAENNMLKEKIKKYES